MIQINFSNVENLIFSNTEVQKILPVHMFALFEQWRLSKKLPYMKELGTQAILIFLMNLKEEDISILEKHFNDKIFVEKLNYNVALDYKILLSENELCKSLCEIENFANFTTWRDDQYLYISLWR